MEWHDEGLILGCRKHGETSVILEVMTRNHGRTLGLVRGGRSRTQQPMLQSGNRVSLNWRARLEDHLGMFLVEPVELRAARLMESQSGILGIQLISAHLRLLPEREALPGVFEAVDSMVSLLPDLLDAAELMVRFEIALLKELGFGLDLDSCAMTGVREGLAFVSPRTGRAVTREAGQPWADKLLALPVFLRLGSNMRPDAEMLAEAFLLTSHFLSRNVYAPRGLEMPQTRDSFVRLVTTIKPEPVVAPALL